MEDTLRQMDAMLKAAYRKEDCPSPQVLQDVLLSNLNEDANTHLLQHLMECGNCREEILVLAQISDVELPAQVNCLATADMETAKQAAFAVIEQLMPGEKAGFATTWKLALRLDWDTSTVVPQAAAFSDDTHDRALRLCRAVMLIQQQRTPRRLEIVADMMGLSSTERRGLQENLLHP